MNASVIPTEILKFVISALFFLQSINSREYRGGRRAEFPYSRRGWGAPLLYRLGSHVENAHKADRPARDTAGGVDGAALRAEP